MPETNDAAETKMRLPPQSPPVIRAMTSGIDPLLWQTQVLVCGEYVPQVEVIQCCVAGMCGTRECDHEERQR